ncbi:MAG: YbaB/EbfC family nucleoid-associated protein [Candidatus Magasanikbacteria bacterium]|nr:YbaB/EbfC family nucleoid-associated protein [Candidatus Magasanikbacteria bacterium]
MFNKLKQFKDLRDKAKELQKELEKETITVNSASGKVTLVMDGTMAMKDLQIDAEMLSPDKKEKLQNAIKDAHKDAMKKMQRIMAMKMKDMGGLPNIPGLN